MRKRMIAAAVGLLTLAVSMSACSSWMHHDTTSTSGGTSSSSSSSSM